MKMVVDFIVEALSSCFFLTYPLSAWAQSRGSRLTGSGFIGTVAGLCSIKLLPMTAFRASLVLVGVILVSVAISDRAEELSGRKDDQRIVIDEWAGYLASMMLLPKTPLVLLCAFVLFRIVDAGKLFGVDYFARLPGGWGIVMDDIAGGLLVNAILRFLPLY